MTAVNRATLYTYFETGDIPSQAQFANLIDSNLNIATTSAQAITADVSALGKLDVTGALTVKGGSATALTGNLVVSGGTAVVSARVSDSIFITGNANITGNSVVSGNSTISGNMAVVGTTIVSGQANFGSNAFFTASAADIISSQNQGLTFEGSTAFVRSFKSAGSNLNIGHATSGAGFINFYYQTGVIGSISATGTTNTAYNTSSDVSKKQNISDMQSALAILRQIKPRTFTWRETGRADNGFIAQELQQIPEVSQFVSTMVDGSLGVDYSRFTAIIIAAIKELDDKVNTLIGSK